jgi:acetyl esterase/lipase
MKLVRPASLIVAAVLVLLSLMVIIPPFTMALAPLVVGALEYSSFLVLLDLAWCIVVGILLRERRSARRATQAMLFIAACIALWPYVAFTRVPNAPRFSLATAVRGLPAPGGVVERILPYTAADGSPLELRLYSLPAKVQRPTVVVIYGGAWRQGAPTQCENVSRALAARGFTVAAIDYRHAPASPYPAAIDDVNRSLQLLRDSAAAWGIDTGRMALLGRSAGGHLAELAAYRPGTLPLRAVVSIYAPFDLVEGYADLPDPDPIGIRAVLEDFIGGTPATRTSAYREASPSSYIRAGLPPTLLLFGGRDHVVKPTFNRDAASKLRAANVPVVAVELPWADHGFDMAPTGLGAQLAFALISTFLERQLK